MASPVKTARALHISKGFTEVIERGPGYLISQMPGTLRRAVTTQTGNRGWHKGQGPFVEADEIDSDWVDADPVLDAPWQKKMVSADYHAYFGPGTDELNAGQIVKYVHPGSGEELTFELQQLQWTNDLSQISAIGDPSAVSPTSISGDDILWEDCFDDGGTPITGLNFRWETQTARLSKFLEIETSSAIGSPPQFIIDGGNPVLKLGFIFQKSTDVEILVDGVVWEESGSEDTAGHIEFRLESTQETLWYFRHPLAQDSNIEPSSPNLTMRVRKQGPNLLVEVLTPWSWLQTATYPVIIDPTTEPQVSSGDADAHERVIGTAYDGTEVFIACTSSTTANQRYMGGFLVTVTGPASEDTVDVAYGIIYCNSGIADDPDVEMFCNDVDDAADFTTDADVASRTLTTAFGTWDVTGLGSGPDNSPTMVSAVQEVIDRAGWNSGQDLMIIWRGVDDNLSRFEVKSYEGSTSQCFQLHLEYTAGGDDDLTANSISTTPVVGTPTIGQTHALTANSIQALSDVGDGDPAIGQEHALSANGISTTPVVENPTLEHIHDLDANSITSDPVLDTPTIGQEHALSANGITTTPELDTPTIGQEHALSADGISSTPVVGTPTLGEGHNLDANGISATPVVDTPTIGQEHALSADGISTTPVVGTPTLSEEGADDLDANGITTTPVVGTPSIGQIHALDASDITATPVVGTPQIGQTHALSVSGITSTPVLDTPTLGTIHVLSADGITTNPVVDTPSFGQVEVLKASIIATPPIVGNPTLVEVNVLSANGISTTPIVGTPATDVNETVVVIEFSGVIYPDVTFSVHRPEIDFSIIKEN